MQAIFSRSAQIAVLSLSSLAQAAPQQPGQIKPDNSFKLLHLSRENDGDKTLPKSGVVTNIETLNLTLPYESSPLIKMIVGTEVHYRGFTKAEAEHTYELLEKVRESVRVNLANNHAAFKSDLVRALSESIDTVLSFHYDEHSKSQSSFISAVTTGAGDCKTMSLVAYDVLYSFGAHPKLEILYSSGVGVGHALVECGVPDKSPYFYDATIHSGATSIEELTDGMAQGSDKVQWFTFPDEFLAAQLLYENAMEQKSAEKRRALLLNALEVCPDHFSTLSALRRGDDAIKAQRKLGGDELCELMRTKLTKTLASLALDPELWKPQTSAVERPASDFHEPLVKFSAVAITGLSVLLMFRRRPRI